MVVNEKSAFCGFNLVIYVYRCHQSNIMSDGIFSVNIAQCVTSS